MKNESLIAPVEYFRANSEYPIHVHVFHRKNITKEVEISKHWHSNIEMTYRIKYKGTIIINGEEFPLTDDSLYIINTGEIHEIHTAPQEEMLAVLVSIPYEFVKTIVPEIDSYRFVVGRHEKDIKKIILKMKEVEENKGVNSYIRMYGLALELLYFLMEDAERIPIFTSNTNSTEHSRMKKSEIQMLLRDNISDIHSVEDISKRLGYSREHLSRFVARNFGVSCKQLIDQIRLDYAIKLMKNHYGSLEKIAETTGFPSYRNFKEVFKKYYGFKPEDFGSKSFDFKSLEK